jgi:quinol monooxygenase YgiN
MSSSDESKNNDRRKFLKSTAGGSAVIAAALAGCSSVQADSTEKKSIKAGVLIVYQSRIKPEFLEEMTNYAAARVPEAREFPGCIDVDIYIDSKDPHNLWTVAYWETIEDNKKYMEWRGQTGVKAEIFTMLEEPPITAFYLNRHPA